MDWHTFFRELKDSGRGAGLFMLLIAGGFACTVFIMLGRELLLDFDWLYWLTLSIPFVLQVVLTLSICALLLLPICAWRDRRNRARKR